MTRQKPRCKKCINWDLETRALVNSLFHFDETELIVSLVACWSASRKAAKDKLSMMHFDFAAQLLGKLYVAMNREQRLKTDKVLKGYGIALNVRDETCPHELEEEPMSDLNAGHV